MRKGGASAAAAAAAAAAGGASASKDDGDDQISRDEDRSPSGAPLEEPAMQVIVLGSGGGPVEDNVTGLLVRSTATEWSKGSVLAVDAGVHMSAIARIMEEHAPSFDGVVDATSQGASGPRSSSERRGRKTVEYALPSTSPSTSRSLRSRSRRLEHGEAASKEPDRDLPAAAAARRKSSGSSSAAAAASYGTVRTGPFAGVKLPSTNARVNAGYFTRELVSTYLITHAHLDHIAGFVINTASLTQTARPKRLAALSPTIDIFKEHIFNDLIWPNLSDEEGGIGLVTYMRLVEGGDVAIGEGDGRGYIEVCEGLGVKSWSISHGVRMNARRRLLMSQSSARGKSTSNSGGAGGGGAGGSSNEHMLSPRGCVYDSTAYFIRDDATGKELLIFGDVEPDAISWNPRTAHVWNEAAPKIAAGTLSAIFIECSYDDSQSDETLFGHLAPRHLIRELRFLGERVRAIKRGDAVGRGHLDAGGDLHDYSMPQAPPFSSRPDPEQERGSFAKRKRKRGGGAGMVDDTSNGLAPYAASTPSLARREGRRKSSAGSRPRRQTSRYQEQTLLQASHHKVSTQDEQKSSVPSNTNIPSPLAWGFIAAAEARIRKDDDDDQDEDVVMLDSHLHASSLQAAHGSRRAPDESGVQEDDDLPLRGVKVVVIHMKDTLRDDPPSPRHDPLPPPLPPSSLSTSHQPKSSFASSSIPASAPTSSSTKMPANIASTTASSIFAPSQAKARSKTRSSSRPTRTKQPKTGSEDEEMARPAEGDDDGDANEDGNVAGGNEEDDDENENENENENEDGDGDGDEGDGDGDGDEMERDQESVQERPGRNILKQLRAYETDAATDWEEAAAAAQARDARNARNRNGRAERDERLGCEFVISRQGGCVWI